MNALENIPINQHHEHSIIGWNKEVRHYYSIARLKCKFRKRNIMQRSSQVFHAMSIQLVQVSNMHSDSAVWMSK